MNATSLRLLIVTILLMLLAAPAGATLTYFSSQSAWEAATSSFFTINFNDVAVPQSTGYADFSTTGLRLHNVTFTESLSTDWLWVIRSGSWQDVYQYAFGAGNYLRGSTWGPRYFQAALPQDVTALAMQILTVTLGHPVTLSFSTGDSRVLSTPASATPVFIGFTFDRPVAWVRIDSTSDLVALDNFAYGQIPQIPEAGTLMLGGLGLSSLLLARGLRRRCASPLPVHRQRPV